MAWLSGKGHGKTGSGATARAEGLICEGGLCLEVAKWVFYMLESISFLIRKKTTFFSPFIYMGGLALMVISPKKWEFLRSFMSTLLIIQPHLKSFNDFI